MQRSNWDTNTKSLWALRFWGAYLLKLDVFFVHPTLIPLPTGSDFYVQLRGQNGWEGKRKGKWIHDRGHYGAFLIWRRMIFQSLRSGTMHLHLDLWLEKASQTLITKPTSVYFIAHFPRTFSGFAFQDAFRHSGIYLVLRFRFGKPQVICHKLNLKGVWFFSKKWTCLEIYLFQKANLSCASATGNNI